MALGIASVAWLSHLPPLDGLLIAALPLLASYRWHKRSWWIGAVALWLGVGWGSAFGHYIRAGLLPIELEQHSLLLQGRLVGLVETEVGYAQKPVLRFQFDATHCESEPHVACTQSPRRVQLSWYDATTIPAAGSTWQLRVKLKRPRGFANPAGFDYAAWLVANRIGAVGTVERNADNLLQAPAPPISIDAWRSRARAYLQQRLESAAHRDLLLGLLVGDGSAIDQAQWTTFRATGTVHLFVVSGLQIALSGGLMLGLSRLWWRSPFAVSTRRSYWLAALPAALVAVVYALLAGFGLPLQRALIMFGLLLWALAARVEIAPSNGWIAALWLVLLGDPLAVLDAGFWFSFAVVGVLIVAVSGRREAGPSHLRWWWAQWAVFVASLPLLLAMTGQFTLLALPANLIAIPLSTLLTMPLALFALLADTIAPSVGAILWRAADLSLDWLCVYLQWLQQHGGALIWHAAGVGAASIAAAAVFASLQLLPRGIPGRHFALWLLLPLLWPRLEPIAPGASRITVVDVGQGLSVLVETAQHRLLYDTGPPFGPERSVAELTLTPLLHQRGIERLDTVVISHRDNDHAGGWAEIEREFVFNRLLVGEDIGAARAEFCRADQHWQWDGVDFAMLYPDATGTSGNNASCVLQIRVGGAAILLAGDIERSGEYQLLDNPQLQALTLLLAPHHGSNSSSTSALIERTQPRYVVFSSGYLNRFHHPHPAVEQRYRTAGSTLFNTATDGALIFTFAADGDAVPQISRSRAQQNHYWD
jgi:competence protein ComEC